MLIFAHLGANEDDRIVMKFCVGLGIPEIITHANLGDDGYREGAESNFSLFY